MSIITRGVLAQAISFIVLLCVSSTKIATLTKRPFY